MHRISPVILEFTTTALRFYKAAGYAWEDEMKPMQRLNNSTVFLFMNCEQYQKMNENIDILFRTT